MKMQLMVDGTLRTIVLDAGEEGRFRGELDGNPVEVEAALIAPGVVSIILRSGPLAGRAFRCVFTLDPVAGKSVLLGGREFSYQPYDPRSLNARKQRSSGGEGPLLIKASMAGRVVRVLVEAGGEVEAHAGVVVIEAMKMQNELRSPRAGRVTEIRVQAGEMVNAGQTLAVIE